jgi:hypothetical protein
MSTYVMERPAVMPLAAPTTAVCAFTVSCGDHGHIAAQGSAVPMLAKFRRQDWALAPNSFSGTAGITRLPTRHLGSSST